jgi:hypothetical protein
MSRECVGWHLDRELVERVRCLAKREGLRPFEIVDESLRQYLRIVEQPIDSGELVRRMMRQQGISGEGIERLLH